MVLFPFARIHFEWLYVDVKHDWFPMKKCVRKSVIGLTWPRLFETFNMKQCLSWAAQEKQLLRRSFFFFDFNQTRQTNTANRLTKKRLRNANSDKILLLLLYASERYIFTIANIVVGIDIRIHYMASVWVSFLVDYFTAFFSLCVSVTSVRS